MTYTPTTDLMREWHVRADHGSKSRKEYEAEFDKWLNEVKAEALEEAAELAEGQDGFEIEIGLANYIGSELRHRAQQLKEEA